MKVDRSVAQPLQACTFPIDQIQNSKIKTVLLKSSRLDSHHEAVSPQILNDSEEWMSHPFKNY